MYFTMIFDHQRKHGSTKVAHYRAWSLNSGGNGTFGNRNLLIFETCDMISAQSHGQELLLTIYSFRVYATTRRDGRRGKGGPESYVQ